MRIEDYNAFDNDLEDEAVDEKYRAFVAWLSEQTAAELQSVKHDPEAQKQALCRYYKRGHRANLSTGELIDFLAVSTPSILDMAGYNEKQADALMQISDNLKEDEVDSVDLPDGIE